MNTPTRHTYGGHPIVFKFGDRSGGNLINATQMVRSFPGKQVAGFLRTQQTKAFIAALEARYADLHNGKRREVLRVVQGGTPEEQGTWMDELLALKFAGWLSAPFEIWMYERIRELLLTGSATIGPGVQVNSDVVGALRAVVSHLEQQETFNDVLSTDIDYLRERIDTVEAKATGSADSYFSVAGYCKLHDIGCTMIQAKAWGREAAALSRQRRQAIGTIKDGRWGSVGTYHELILREVCV